MIWGCGLRGGVRVWLGGDRSLMHSLKSWEGDVCAASGAVLMRVRQNT